MHRVSAGEFPYALDVHILLWFFVPTLCMCSKPDVISQCCDLRDRIYPSPGCQRPSLSSRSLVKLPEVVLSILLFHPVKVWLSDLEFQVVFVIGLTNATLQQYLFFLLMDIGITY